MTVLAEIRRKVESNLNDVDWQNPYWLDEVKEEFADQNGNEIDSIYFDELKKKIDSLDVQTLKSVHAEQVSLTSANQNFLLQELIEEKIGVSG